MLFSAKIIWHPGSFLPHLRASPSLSSRPQLRQSARGEQGASMSISTVAARALRAIAPRAQHQARDAVVCASVATSSIPGTSRCSPSLAVARREQFAGVRHVSGKAPQLPSRFGPRAEGETNEPTPYQQQVPNDPRLNRPTDPRLNRPERGNKKRTAVRLLPRRKRYVPGEVSHER